MQSKQPMTRRDWLLGAAAAPAFAAPRWKMRLSTSSVQFSSLPVEEACRKIAALGFEAVDFWPANFKCPHLDEIENRLGADGLRELLAKTGLKLCAFTGYQTNYAKYWDLLGKAGGGVIVRESKYGVFDKPAAEIRKLIETLKPDLELAERHGCYLAVENHGKAALSSLDSFKAFVDLAGHPRLGIALAPYHLQQEGIPVADVIRMVGPKLLFFYAWQFGKDTAQLPGIGPADFLPWLSALAGVRYDRYVNPFMHGHPPVDDMKEALAKSKRYLEDCYRRL